jgi:hypothetical protein
VEPLPTNTLLELRPSWTTAPTVPRSNNTKSSTSGNESSNGKNTDTDIRVVTYNILADQNAFNHNKMPVYLHELVSYQADILCLQEVDEGVFYPLFQPLWKDMVLQDTLAANRVQAIRKVAPCFGPRADSALSVMVVCPCQSRIKPLTP